TKQMTETFLVIENCKSAVSLFSYCVKRKKPTTAASNIMDTCVKGVCQINTPMRANRAMTFVFKLVVNFFIMPNIACATTATATIFNPCIQPALPTSISVSSNANIKSSMTDGNVNPINDMI